MSTYSDTFSGWLVVGDDACPQRVRSKAIHGAAYRGQPEIVQILADHGVLDVNDVSMC